MKDDYLWDRTGETDPEIEHMERVLGQLRHRRKASDLPPFEVKVRRTAPPFSKVLAMAAAFTFLALVLGALMVFQRRSGQNAAPVVMVNPVPSPPSAAPSVAPATEAVAPQSPDSPAVTTGAPDRNPKRASSATRRREINRSREATINEREQAQGLMAKEQLIKALQITSSKLDVVQKKVQGPVS
jgi:hypothetical protein